MIGKTTKYTLWASFSYFLYHMYLLKKKKDPQSAFLSNPWFLEKAKQVDWAFYDLSLLLTRPPVEKLLFDKPPMPPG